MQGEYMKQRGRDKFGQAIWRQASGAGWLFSSGPEGFWCFAVRESDIGNKLGQVQSALPHNGCAPDKILQWQYHDWSTWRVDETIRVTVSGEEFQRALRDQAASRGCAAEGDRLWILAPPHASLQGEYLKQPGRTERGQPVWRQVDGSGALFSTAKGRWFISDGEAGIALNGGVISTTSRHDGRPPQDAKQWQYYHEGKWRPDAAILVTAEREESTRRLAEQEKEALEKASRAPGRLWLICLPKPGLQGEYVRQPGRVERGEAVWQQVDGSGVLYSNGLGGLWCFANKEADIMKNVGILQSSAPHEGKAPDEVPGWQYADGSSWRPDGGILVTSSEEQGLHALAEQRAEALRLAEEAPQSLWLASPAQPLLQGQYEKQQDRIERGQACWRQADGDGWLYSTAGGRWFVADREDAIALCSGLIASAGPHGGSPPQAVEQWQTYSEGSWHLDVSVRFSSSRDEFKAAAEPSVPVLWQGCVDAPERFWLVAPVTPQLEGEYAREDRPRHGLSVWRRAGGGGWLYGKASAGRWCFVREEADVAAGRALLRSCGLEAAEGPQAVARWQLAEELDGTDDLVWKVEPSIRIVNSPEEAASLAPLPLQKPPPAPRVLEKPLLAPLPLDKTTAVPLSLESCSPSELRERVRVEVRRLLATAGLTAQIGGAGAVDEDVLVEDCVTALHEASEDGETAVDQEAVARAVLRLLLTGWGQGRRITHVAMAGTTEGCEAQEDVPQLFCSCQPQRSAPMARRHYVRNTSPQDITVWHEEATICHQGCPDPCAAGGPCVVS